MAGAFGYYMTANLLFLIFMLLFPIVFIIDKLVHHEIHFPFDKWLHHAR
jgi:hypothetical protein